MKKSYSSLYNDENPLLSSPPKNIIHHKSIRTNNSFSNISIFPGRNGNFQEVIKILNKIAEGIKVLNCSSEEKSQLNTSINNMKKQVNHFNVIHVTESSHILFWNKYDALVVLIRNIANSKLKSLQLSKLSNDVLQIKEKLSTLIDQMGETFEFNLVAICESLTNTIHKMNQPNPDIKLITEVKTELTHIRDSISSNNFSHSFSTILLSIQQLIDITKFSETISSYVTDMESQFSRKVHKVKIQNHSPIIISHKSHQSIPSLKSVSQISDLSPKQSNSFTHKRNLSESAPVIPQLKAGKQLSALKDQIKELTETLSQKQHNQKIFRMTCDKERSLLQSQHNTLQKLEDQCEQYTLTTESNLEEFLHLLKLTSESRSQYESAIQYQEGSDYYNLLSKQISDQIDLYNSDIDILSKLLQKESISDCTMELDADAQNLKERISKSEANYAKLSNTVFHLKAARLDNQTKCNFMDPVLLYGPAEYEKKILDAWKQRTDDELSELRSVLNPPSQTEYDEEESPYLNETSSELEAVLSDICRRSSEKQRLSDAMDHLDSLIERAQNLPRVNDPEIDAIENEAISKRDQWNSKDLLSTTQDLIVILAEQLGIDPGQESLTLSMLLRRLRSVLQQYTST